MTKLFRWFKYIIISSLITLAVIYSGLYILLSIPSVQQKAKDITVRELKQLLHTELSIAKVTIHPFNKISITDLYLQDLHGDTLLYTNRLSAGFEILPLFRHQLIFTTAQLFGFDVNIHRETPQSKPNFQFLIDAFRSKDTLNPKRHIDIQINSLLVRRGSLRYDVWSEPHKEPGQFDKNHIEVKNLLSTLSLRSLQKDSINAYVKRLSFDEKSGLSLNKLTFKLLSNSKKASLEDFELRLPHSRLQLDTTTVDMSRMTSFDQFADSASIRLKIDRSQIVLSDLAPLAPALAFFKGPLTLSCDIRGEVNHLQARQLRIEYSNEVFLSAEASIDGITTPRNTYLFGEIKELYASAVGINSIINGFNENKKEIPETITRLGSIRFKGDISGFFTELVAYGKLYTSRGSLQSDIMLSLNREKGTFAYNGTVATAKFDLGGLFNDGNPFGEIGFKLDLHGKSSKNGSPEGKLVGEITNFDFKGYPYKNIQVNGNYNAAGYDGMLNIDDPNGHLYLSGIINLLQKTPLFHFSAKAEKVRLHELKLIAGQAGSDLSFGIDANFTGNNIDNAEGVLTLDSLLFNKQDSHFFMDRLTVTANNKQFPQSIAISSSDFVNGRIVGRYNFKTLVQTFTDILSSTMPAIVQSNKKPNKQINDFAFSFSIDNTEALSSIFNLPVTLIQNSTISGYLNETDKRFKVEASLPEFKIKRSRFESGLFLAEKMDDKINVSLRASSLNQKNQLMMLTLTANAANDIINTRFNWSNVATTTFSGELSAQTHFIRKKGNFPLTTDISVNQSELIINDTIWNINPAAVTIDSGRVTISNFEIRQGSQFLQLAGSTSRHPEDILNLRLNDINLNYIFQTLNIRFVNFGGRATGDFLISNLMQAPRLNTKKFDVKDFAYNDAVLGDLQLYSEWDNENRGILLRGGISQPGLPDTKIDGYIYPTRDSLALHFDASKLNLSFLRPFVDKILVDMSGYAYGPIDFFGRFSALNVTGDAYLQDLSFGIDYLNTTYSLSDSIHLRKHSIYFDNIIVHDKDKNTARARGILNHSHFKDLSYDIGISDIHNLLVFNITERQNPVYYGTIYGSGAATLKGDLTKTNIDVNMRTNAKSKFTFALSNTQTAGDYQFITFTDNLHRQKTGEKEKDKTTEQNGNPVPPVSSNNITVNLQIDVTPDATMQLIMDPSSGDMIKANGSGNIRIEYNTYADMKMYGFYTLDKGSYNFSLQDLITREFSIKSGSNITFRGTPMSADMDITAIYSVTANLLDLDEGFAEQKELTRTNVPVQTILNITGDLQRPELKFDIAVPTLTQDIERRVKSIISTDDMMNRQIIYLLALGKFYTPDYMNVGQNRNNELASVASSTLSSQLNNMLSQISDNWNIGTNIRSDKGDFSDVEFELALSSQLLNNRLIFNGNFGYRDNTRSNNNFIGDFDLEYLLSASGNLRLKAYNHYNDKNYYIKSALTTQGVGIVFKKDFTHFSDLFYRIRRNMNKQKEKKNKSVADSLLISVPPITKPVNENQIKGYEADKLNTTPK